MTKGQNVMAGHTDIRTGRQKIGTSVLQIILLKNSFIVFSHQNNVFGESQY